MKKIFFTLLFLFTITIFSYAQKAFVNQIINSVNIDSLMLTVKQLSGDTNIILNNQIDSITSRYADSPDVKKATAFIGQKFKSFGLTPVEQSYLNYKGYSGKNIYAYQQGTDKSNNCYIICAHYDNLPLGARNYGSDDNGSGVAAVLEAARLLSKHSLPFSIYYILFDHEELGLIGSDYWAGTHLNGDTPVLGTINIDMIAYDGNNDSVANIHISNVQQLGKNISDKLIDTDSIYNIGINLKVYTDAGPLSSDHASFWQYFMPAVLFIEDDKTGDFNPKYHTVYDRINLFNTSYYHRMAKLAIGTLAGFVSDSSHVGIKDISTQENNLVLYPNPVNNSFTIDHISGKKVLVKLISTNGEIVFEKVVITENEKLMIQLPPHFPNGLYHVLLINKESVLHKSFLKE